MDFKNCAAFVVPFCVQESSAWEKVIQYLSEQETTPVEAVFQSGVVSIAREYYPVEQLEIQYTAKWDAISIFKQRWTQEETHYEQQVHFFDRFGGEHEKPGFDYYDTKAGRWKSGSAHPFMSSLKGNAGDAGTRPWRPVEVTVPVTENIAYERETGRKRNAGEVTGKHNYYHGQEYPFPMHLEHSSSDVWDALLCSGVFPRANSEPTSQRIPYSREAVKDGIVIEQSKPMNERNFDSQLSKAKTKAQNECIKEIPGQAYADFRMEFHSNEVCEICYYPVYHVVYEFRGQKYECFVSGNWTGEGAIQYEEESGGRRVFSQREGTVKGKHNPEDASIESIQQQYDNECAILRDRKKKSWIKFLIWIYLAVMFTLGCLGAVLNGPILAVPSLAITMAVYFFCRKSYGTIKNIRKEIEKNEEAKRNIIPVRQAKKKAIMEIVLNDNLSDSVKKMQCETILYGR